MWMQVDSLKYYYYTILSYAEQLEFIRNSSVPTVVNQ